MKTIHVNQLHTLENPFIIDVREEEEQAHGMIPNAISMPLMTLPFVLEKLPEDKTIYIVCRSANRSHQACLYLSDLGYDCANVLGGMLEYTGSLVYPKD